MAMTNLTWHYVTFAAVTAPLWNGGGYEAPSFVIDAIALGTPVLVFCRIDFGIGAAALISFPGGGATIPSGAVTVVGTPAMNISVTSTSENWYSVRDSAGTGWYWYGDQSGLVNYMPTSGPLGLFIT